MDRIGKYKLQKFLGEGGFGRVYEAFDPALERRVAIKTCRRSGAEGEEDRERFLREARIAAKLDHENITKIFDLGYDQDHDVEYVVQEYLAGQDLQQMIHTRAAVPHAVRVHYLVQIASGLEHAHRHHVVHRDVKPTNIRVLPDHRIKILDFGIAKEMAGDAHGDLTGTGVSMGTLAYSAPEQIYSSRRADARADIFSFGVVAYELLAYQHPFPGGNLVHKIQHAEPLPLQDHWPECPPGLAEAIHTCLRKRRQERHQSFSALRPVLLAQAVQFNDELESFLKEAPRLTSLSTLMHERDVMPTRAMGRRYTTGRKLPPPPEEVANNGGDLPPPPVQVVAPMGMAAAAVPVAAGVAASSMPAGFADREPRSVAAASLPAAEVVPVSVPAQVAAGAPAAERRPASSRLPRAVLLVALVIVVLTVVLTWRSASNTNASTAGAEVGVGEASPSDATPGASTRGSTEASSQLAEVIPRLRLTLEVTEVGVYLRAEPPARALSAKLERFQVYREPAWNFGERQYIAGRQSAPLSWTDKEDLVPGESYRYHVEAVGPERQILAHSSPVEIVYAPLPAAEPMDSSPVLRPATPSPGSES